MQVIITEEEYNNLKARAISQEDFHSWEMHVAKVRQDVCMEIVKIVTPIIKGFPLPTTNKTIAMQIKDALHKLGDAINTYPKSETKETV